MTALELSNKFLFQFLFIRIAKEINVEDVESKAISWGFLFPVVPLTGWNTPYIGNTKYRRILRIR